MGKFKNLQTLCFNDRTRANEFLKITSLKKQGKGPKSKEHTKDIYRPIYSKMIYILCDSPLSKMHEEMALSFNLRSQHIQKQAALILLWY